MGGATTVTTTDEERLTLVELLGRVTFGRVGEEHPSQQSIRAGDVLLADPVIHNAKVGIVSRQETQQC